jgi:hypothetical protein
MKQFCTICGVKHEETGQILCTTGYTVSGAAGGDTTYTWPVTGTTTVTFSTGGASGVAGGGAGGAGGGVVYTIPAGYSEPEIASQYLIDGMPIDEYEIAVIRELRKRRASEEA